MLNEGELAKRLCVSCTPLRWALENADPQAGRYPGGYPPWPAGARRRAIVGVASE
ncbi:hypothetical protein [Bradyrhizobium sp. Tv2a-2]|uniref:hypothetical protein n=1 Tax=Bradyrhizobium sp. Tv2a-2 TaxID=113395 RepID=UPI00040F7229|nr:hypothetical protein [Bradyrhizobium sp. Tv2a-2]